MRRILLTVLLLPGLACQGASSDPAATGRRVEALSAAGPRLAPRASWQPRGGGPGRVRVTPRWLAGSEALLARGEHGRGLFRLDHGGAPVEPGILPRVEVDPDLGALLLDDGERRLYHHGFRGRITAVATDGAERVLVEGGPWAVAVSPDGRRIAYSTGRLEDPMLHLYEEGRGAWTVGRGAQACWFPDGRFLVYAVPGRVVRRGSLTTFQSSELHLYDADQGTTKAFTATPDLAEMEPAVSPGGDVIAFADWHGGAVWIAPLAREGAP